MGSIFLMSMALFFTIAIVFKWGNGKKIGWICGMMTFVFLGCNRFHQWHAKEMIIYHSYKGLLIDAFDGGKCYSLLDCSLSPESIEFTTRGNRCKMDIIGVDYLCLQDYLQKENDGLANKAGTCFDDSLLIWHKPMDCVESGNYRFVVFNDCPDNVQLASIQLDTTTTYILPAHLNRYCKKQFKSFLQVNRQQIYDIDSLGYLRLMI
jgi:hypothetical protein